MEAFTVHTPADAPEGSRPALEATQQAYGFIPNVFGVLAGAPAAIDAFVAIGKALSASSLSPTEQQVVLIEASVANGCDYCVAAHSTVAGMQQVPAETVAGLRGDTPLTDSKLEALRAFTRQVVDGRGRVAPAALAAMSQAGYGTGQVLEVLTAVALKTLSNYANHLAETPLDEAFGGCAWSPGQAAASG